MLRTLFDNLEEYLLAAGLSIMVLVVAAQILCRYFFDLPLDWSEEVARFTFVWLIYLGASMAIKKRRHLKIDAGLFLFPKKLRPWIELLGKLLFMVFAGILFYDSLQHWQRVTWIRPQTSPALMLSMGYAYGAIPFSFGLMLVRLVQDCLRFFKNREYLDVDVLARIAAEELGDVLPGK